MGSEGASPTEPAAAVAHWRALSREHPGQYDRQLATSLLGDAQSQAVAGDMVGALASSREALDLWQRLDEASPSHEPQLGSTLFVVSVYLSQLGNVQLARSMAEDAVRFWRRASAVDPSERIRLAKALQVLSACYNQTKMPRQSLTCEKEAIAIRRELYAAGTGETAEAMAKHLDKFARRLIAFGETDQAIAIAHEATEHWKHVAAEDPEGGGAGLLAALKQLGSLLGERPVSAPESAREGRRVLRDVRRAKTTLAFRWFTRTRKIQQAK